MTLNEIQDAARKCLMKAGTTFRPDQFRAYQKAIETESDDNARWVLEQIVENARIAESEQLPLCDDTGIPHIIVHIGEACTLPAGWIDAVQKGIVAGLREMPGRPMAVQGDDIQRVEQSHGLHSDPGALEPAPMIVRPGQGNQFKLTILLLGGGPEIRAKTRRIFHKRSMNHVIDEVTGWLTREIGSLGCTPCIPAVGIGRSQAEASELMLEAMAEGNLDAQSELEKKITLAMNQTRVGPLGLGGATTALGCFLKIGPIRASGVRIASARPCCLVEVRMATVVLPES
jgi:fumarate hydratase subunit alpha